MPDLRRILLLASAWICGAVVGAGTAGASAYELRNTATMNERLGRAVDVVNAAVRDPALELYFFNREPHAPPGTAIPVYHVAPAETDGVVAEVPFDCRCIIVNGAQFERSFALLESEGALMKDKHLQMLIFLMLHELGHIAHGHYGQFIARPTDAPRNDAETDAKRREAEADGFVARILGREFGRLGTGEPPIDDYGLYFDGAQTTMFLGSLSFVVAANATLNCFGCRVLGDPRIFWDHGLSHPNFEYRLLQINNSIARTPDSQKLLDDYEQQRAAIGTRGPTIYYRAPGVTLPGIDPPSRPSTPAD